VKLSEEYIKLYGIPTIQNELYFIILPLRHTLEKEYCTTAINLIKLFDQANITDRQKWTNFICASYRSFYNATSHIEKNPSNILIDEFKKTYIKYKDIIDPKIISLDNLHMNLTNNIIFKELMKEIPSDCKNICVSLSGGVDSMVIVHALSILKKTYDFTVYAVHIHHFNRDEAEIEAKMIEEFCNLLEVRYFQIDISHLKRGEINRDFYETETRRIRFDFYRNLKKHHNIDFFALGHHRGDLAENVLVNVIKGRSLTDLPVMKRFDCQEGITIWRPFIDIPKSDIWNYAEQYGIIYTKNSTPEWSVRGKFRNILLPLLNDMFNSVEENLYNSGLESRELNEYVEKNVVSKVIENVHYGKYGFCFSCFRICISFSRLLERTHSHFGDDFQIEK
jgi:tRNA(Ile)-lysidine synthetase-like protein